MRRLIVLVAGTALLVLAGSGLHWQLRRGAERALRDLARTVAPLATLTWRESWAGFDGRIGARGVVIERRSDGWRVAADGLWLDFGSLPDLLRAGGDTFPAHLRLGISGLALQLEAVAVTSDVRPLGLESLEVAPCAGLDAQRALQTLGHDPLAADLELGYLYDAALGQLALEARISARRLWDLDLTLALEGPSAPTAEGFMSGAPLARRGTLAITEHGWYSAVASLCAQRTGLDANAWLEAHFATVVELLAASGVVASSELLVGYRGFRRAPQSARLTFDNAARLGVGELLGLDPDEFGRALGIRVEFNGRAVADARIDLASSQQLPATAPLADLQTPTAGEALVEPSVRALVPSVVAPPPVAPPRSAARRVAPAPSRAVSWDMLGRNRGRWITVTLRDGRQHIGILRAVSADQLTLEKRVFGGAVTFPLKRAAVARISAMP